MGLRPKIFCAALLGAGLALAQEQRPDDPKAQDQPEPQQTYEGPSILSRDKGLIGERGGKLIDFRYYGEVTGVYDSGLTPFITDAQGNLINAGANYGVEAGYGVIGSRRWKRDWLSLEYKGTYRHYSNSTYFDGLDQFLNLAYNRALTKRFQLALKETAGTISLANGGFSYLPLTNTDLFAVPANELFDTRTNFLQSRVDLTWQKTARLSFSAGGEGFVVRRASLALAGLNGYSARADAAYRLTKRQTVSAGYRHTYFDFQRAFGNATLETVALGYSIELGRNWDFSMQAGGIRVEALGLTTVAIDPAIAAIVGHNTAIVSFFRVLYAPLVETRLIRRFERSALTFSYSNTTSPGNGVYLTSRQNAGSARYSYTGYKRFTAEMVAGYSQLSAVGQTLGKYTNLQGGAGITYKLVRDAHLELRYDFRHYTTQNTLFQKDSNRVSLGLAFSPGDKPLAIW